MNETMITRQIIPYPKRMEFAFPISFCIPNGFNNTRNNPTNMHVNTEIFHFIFDKGNGVRSSRIIVGKIFNDKIIIGSLFWF